MKLNDMQIRDFLKEVQSASPAPGGGSVAALYGACGAALFTMVGRLTIGREKYADYELICNDAIREGERLMLELSNQIEEDTEAYNSLSEAYKLPKESEEEKIRRSSRIAECVIQATEIPLKTMIFGHKALDVLSTLVSHSNPNAASDLGVASAGILACVEGAWLNVLINISSIKDNHKAQGYKDQGFEILTKARSLSKSILDKIESSL